MVDDSIEKQCWSNGKLLIGCDEAGYGCIAGSMFVAIACFDRDFNFSKLIDAGLNDSKKLTEKKRFELGELIKKSALCWSCVKISADQIDNGNPWKLRFVAIIPEVEHMLNKYPESTIIMDGNFCIPLPGNDSRCLVKGDGKNCTIAAASIIAKTEKDKEMLCLDSEFPVYRWRANKGYGTKEHKEAILKYGITKHHRKSYIKDTSEKNMQ